MLWKRNYSEWSLDYDRRFTTSIDHVTTVKVNLSSRMLTINANNRVPYHLLSIYYDFINNISCFTKKTRMILSIIYHVSPRRIHTRMILSIIYHVSPRRINTRMILSIIYHVSPRRQE